MTRLPQQPKCALARTERAVEVIISYLLVTRVDFGSVKQHTAVIENAGGCTVPYRSKLDHDAAQISRLCHFSDGGCGCTGPVWSVGKVVPFDEIVINPSNPKHTLKPLRYVHGLGVVIATHKHLWGAFNWP